MSGKLTVIGTGPGNPDQMTPETKRAVEEATDFFGYGPYLDRIDYAPHQKRHASDNREELARASQALQCAFDGNKVCVVSGGDPGVFAMASAICEALEKGPEEWRSLDISILPGITAMLAVSARCGAPLGHDFCAINLSNNLKPWELIEHRLKLAAEAGLVMAFYNPISKARPWQLGKAFDVLRSVLPPETVVIFGRAAGREDERMTIVTLSEAKPDMADMATCIIIGSDETRIIPRPGMLPIVYTPRFSHKSG
jgi:precorrin-3B C17-methyltransferase